MITIQTAGRNDVADYFRISGVFDGNKINHSPLLVFITNDNSVTVKIVRKSYDLLEYPDDTPVMGQWRGDWSSDYFQFTVGQYREFYNQQFEPLKKAHDVVKKTGRGGGFRSLSYHYINDKGYDDSNTTYDKSKADHLEKLFNEAGIPIQIEREW